MPTRRVAVKRPLSLPADEVFQELRMGLGIAGEHDNGVHPVVTQPVP